MRELPARVRAYVYLTWAGMALSALGILGFFLSFNAVAGPSRWAVGVHRDIPWGAYTAIFAWVTGLIVTWFGRKRIDAAVRARKRELEDAARVELD
ncbi:MAG: hypothetical protein QMD76_01155 [Anaerosomatales bacterium]|nr:hypothetical protein [Anaerosomatales bacterium]MDI6843055.1 hypothetical protein [Anaerosomatales bacterium]